MAERAHPPFLNYQPAICRARGGRRSSPLAPRPRGFLPRQRCAEQTASAARLRSFPFPKPGRAGCRRTRRHKGVRVLLQARSSARQICPELGPVTLPPLFFRQFFENVRTSRYQCTRVLFFSPFSLSLRHFHT